MSTGIHAKIERAAYQLYRDWYLIDEPNYEVQVQAVTPLIGPLYHVTLKLVVWSTFTTQAIFIDGEEPSLLIDASVLHSLITGPLFDAYRLDNNT